jgi:acyl-ACP thioesterase
LFVELAELVGEPASGRVFERTLMPGIADGLGNGRIRLDAIARWLQDVAYADLLDAGFEQEGIWIVRRVRIRVDAFPRFGQTVTLRTFCSGLGRFSAERRTTLSGPTAAVEAVALWIWTDESGEPARFPPRFAALYGESAAGRGAPVRLRHPDPPPAGARSSWTFRAADVDVGAHVNNSHFWEPLEECLAGSDPVRIDAEIEHREAAQPGEVYVLSEPGRLWIVGDSGATYASLRFDS